MASLRNALPRREHHERAQPSERAKKGFLEKHKDYKQRADDFHGKQRRLKALKERAALRNPEEFYYGMIRATRDHPMKRKDRTPKNKDQVLLAKTRDGAYLAMQAATERRKLERLRESRPQAFATGVKRTRTFFVDEDEDVEHVDTSALVGLGSARNEKGHPLAQPDSELDRQRRVEKRRKRDVELIKQRQQREKVLRDLVAQVDLEKHIMAKGAKWKVSSPEGTKPASYRWRKQRKR